jgi:nucleotide-binding universal stress UspA family protein
VIAARRHTLVGRWLLGSTAERTVRAARCPVAVIPPPGEASGEAVARAGDPARPLRVLVGVDLGPASVRAVELVDELRRSRPCQVTLVHLYWPPDEFDRLGLRGPRELADPDPDVVRDLDARLRQRLGPAVGGPGMKLVIRPAWGGPVANLLLAAGEDGCDLLVVGADERHGLARITQPTVARALAGRPGPVPVICVPAPQGAAEAAVPAALPRLLTVLAPTDLSRTGNRAVAYAYALLRAQGGVVELCHVHERPLPVPAYVYEEKKGRLGPGQRTALEAELRALIPAEAERLGITTHVSIIDGGEAATAIVQASERLAVDAIALGSHGHGIAARALLGSVADKVVRHAHRPVLVVRAG